MSMNNWRQALADIPGGSEMTMSYGQGGRTQVFKILDDLFEMGPDATPSDLRAEYFKKKVKSTATPFTQSQQSQAT